MTLGRRLVTVAAGAVLAVAVTAGAPPHASAQAALPYLAYGVGLTSGQVVEAYLGDTSVGRTTADAAGRWKIQIAPAGAGTGAENGDRITFRVDGRPAGSSVEFRSGHFPPPPGIALGVASAQPSPPPPPSLRATPAPRATVTSKAKPTCTKNGRPIACSAKPSAAATPRAITKPR